MVNGAQKKLSEENEFILTDFVQWVMVLYCYHFFVQIKILQRWILGIIMPAWEKWVGNWGKIGGRWERPITVRSSPDVNETWIFEGSHVSSRALWDRTVFRIRCCQGWVQSHVKIAIQDHFSGGCMLVSEAKQEIGYFVIHPKHTVIFMDH